MRRIMGATRTLAQTSQSVQMPSNKVCSHRYLLWARRPFFCVGRRAGAHPDRPVAARVQTLSPALAVSLCRRASGPTAGGLRHLLTGAAVACARPHRCKLFTKATQAWQSAVFVQSAAQPIKFGLSVPMSGFSGRQCSLPSVSQVGFPRNFTLPSFGNRSPIARTMAAKPSGCLRSGTFCEAT